MRIHALHVQGLDAPREALNIPIHPGYTLLMGPGPSLLALRELMLALLYPEEALGALSARRHSEAERCRAVLTLQLGADVYRVGADLDWKRLVLARFDSKADRFNRVAIEPEEASQKLRELGRPDRPITEALGFLTPSGAPSRAPGLLRPAEAGSSPPEVSTADPIEPPTLAVLPTPRSDGSPLRVELEREKAEVEGEIEQYGAIAESEEDLDLLIQRYRALREDCENDLTILDRTRDELLEERGRRERVPGTQVPWIWLGMTLGASGASAGYYFDPAIGLIGLLGIGVSATAFTIARRAQRWVGRIDARIAALRVRERAVEQRFEESAGPVRRAVVALKLDSVDELERAVTRMRELSGRLAEVERALTAPSPQPVRPPEPIPVMPTAAPAPRRLWTGRHLPDDGLADLFLAAASFSGRDLDELRTEVRACLPLYLRALTGGQLRDLVPIGGDLWGAVREEGAAVPTDALTDGEGVQVRVALHLALLERLAPTGRLPLLVSPTESTGEFSGLARALSRLARSIQVIQLAESESPWASFAGQVNRI
ncbi:MAG: hypothetical protein V3T14_09885 [Myxococcota bacterium]